MKVGLRVVDELTLENVKLHCNTIMGGHALSMMGINSYVDTISHNIVHHLHTYILGEKTKQEEVKNRFRYPANWWEHLKYEHAPKWFVKRWPVQWKHESRSTTVKHYQCVPMFNKILDPIEQKYTFPTMTIEPARQVSFPVEE